jgi:hypothetical protein
MTVVKRRRKTNWYWGIGIAVIAKLAEHFIDKLWAVFF